MPPPWIRHCFTGKNINKFRVSNLQFWRSINQFIRCKKLSRAEHKIARISGLPTNAIQVKSLQKSQNEAKLIMDTAWPRHDNEDSKIKNCILNKSKHNNNNQDSLRNDRLRERERERERKRERERGRDGERERDFSLGFILNVQSRIRSSWLLLPSTAFPHWFKQQNNGIWWTGQS